MTHQELKQAKKECNVTLSKWNRDMQRLNGLLVEFDAYTPEASKAQDPEWPLVHHAYGSHVSGTKTAGWSAHFGNSIAQFVKVLAQSIVRSAWFRGTDDDSKWVSDWSR